MNGQYKNVERKVLQYMQTHDSGGILNMIIALQMNPANRGGNVRMEHMARYAALTLNEADLQVNFSEFGRILSEAYRDNELEDPPINMHSETFAWLDGNHTIFPGVAPFISERLNLLNAALFLTDEQWPEEFYRKTAQAFMLILSLGDMMADRARYEGCIKGGNNARRALDYPKSYTDFGISDCVIKSILYQYGIADEILDDFVLDPEAERESLCTNVADNPLLSKPIIRYKGNYYFLLITNQAEVLYNYVLREAERAGCIEQLTNIIYSAYDRQVKSIFSKMGWSPIAINIGQTPIPNTKEYILRFDTNSYAHLSIVHRDLESPISDQELSDLMSQRLIEVEHLVANHKTPDRYMAIVLYTSARGAWYCRLYDVPQCPLQIWPVQMFVSLAKAENWERFDLFHYADARHRMGRKLVDIDPIDTYAIYKQYAQSFYVTDADVPVITPEANMGYPILQNHKLNLNYHAVERLYDGHPVYVGVFRESEDMPLYKPLYYDENTYLQCIDNGAIPIWVSCEEGKKEADMASMWGDAILYWLHYIIENEDISDCMPHLPQEIKIHFVDTKTERPYVLESIENGVQLLISSVAIKDMMGPDNGEERKLIAVCIDGLTGTKIGKEIVDKYIPIGEAKMIVCYAVDSISEANPMDCLQPLLVMQASQQRLWDELPAWMKEEGKEFSGELMSKDEKTKGLNDMVAVCLAKIKQIAAVFDYPYLLRRAIWHYDTLIWKGEWDKVHTSAQIVCFGKNEEQMSKIRENNLRLVRSSLGLRCLIEYLASQPSNGGAKYIGDYDLEYMVTIMCEAIYYGSIRDQVFFDVGQVRIAHLPSGRYGVNQEQLEDKLFAFHDAYTEQLIDGMIRDYPRVFESKSSEAPHPDDIRDATNAAFKTDWGVSFQEIGEVCGAMSTMCVARAKSVLQMSEETVVAEIMKQSGIDETTIRAAIDKLSLQPREAYLQAPKGYSNTEVYPWRYNREFSFARRFIVKIKDGDGSINLIFGQRNALAAFKQLIYRLVDGQLNVPERDGNIKKIVGRYSEVKGKAFNNQVRAYLQDHTALDVADYDVPIDKEHFHSADKNYGDIDVLAYDKHGGIAYNIECKDTVMAKNIYQMHIEIRKFLGLNEKDRKDALVWKHYRRHEWLCLHKEELADFLGVERVTEIKSVVLTSSVLPVSFLHRQDSPLPIISYHELEEAHGDIGKLMQHL